MTSMLPSPRTRAARLALLVAVTGTLVTGCSREPPKAPEKPPVQVSVQTIQRHDVPVTAVYVAQTQSSQAVNVQARVSGWLDKRMYVEGSVVKRGQVLFQMDPKPFQAQLDAAKAALQRNQAALQVATQNLNRTKPLAQQNALSQKDLDDAQGQYEQSGAAVEQAKAQVTQAELDLSYTTIRSPVDGVSSFAVVADGTYLSPQNAQLTTVSVLTPMWVNFSVSENEMERIRNDVRNGLLRLPEGGRFIVVIEMVDGNLFPYSGAITFADPSYNATTGTFMLRATVNNPSGVLRPNQYVRVRLEGAMRPNAIVVPQRAVQQSAKGHFVWVVDTNNHAEMRPVVVGEWRGEGWIISEGLANGEKVVVDGGIRLSEGAAVKATEYVEPAKPASPAPASGGPAAQGATPGGSTVPGATRGNPAAGKAALPLPYPSATPSSVAIYFPTGQSTLDTGAQRALRIAAAAYVGIGTRIQITGYADRTGDPAANAELAKKRAQAVRDELVNLGVEARRLELVPPSTVTGSGTDDQTRRVDLRVQQ